MEILSVRIHVFSRVSLGQGTGLWSELLMIGPGYTLAKKQTELKIPVYGRYLCSTAGMYNTQVPVHRLHTKAHLNSTCPGARDLKVDS